ncbi:ribonuclease P protein component [uncultured Serinicoccus sp.]|uniref:ribonuclease P protein component n=1 Tax=uncultured Serinicoccus sp. TaxID=735514 RepID=UPI002633DE1B|nr:ribonuclease P protein component [uncultured Serinicoccus sp.]
MLARRHRLTSGEDFRSVLRGRGDGRRRQRAGTDLLVVHVCLPRPDATAVASVDTCPRVGFVVSKAVGNSVVRHRTARRLRHLVADRVEGLPPAADVVVRALAPAAQATSAELGAALDQALARAVTRRS